MSKAKITIFTPCYNRAHTLPRLYDSLKRQNCKDFEWIIVDDGSSDNTQELISEWKKKEKDFPIIFLRTENGGKHRAINKGVELSSTDFFFIVDSDDYITDNAIESIQEMISSFSDKELEKFAGVSGTKTTADHKSIGGTGDKSSSFIDATNLEREKYNLTGDKAEVYRTSILKKYPFPSFEGENFLSEEIVWDKIARAGFKIRWFNRPLMICEYRNDGLSKNLEEINKKNPKGFALYIRNKLRKTEGAKEKLRTLYSYYLPMRSIQSDTEICKALKINRIKLLELKLVRFLKRG